MNEDKLKTKAIEWASQLGVPIEQLGHYEIPGTDLAGACLVLIVHLGYNDKVWGNKLKLYWPAFADKIQLALGDSKDLPEMYATFCSFMEVGAGGRNQHQRKIATEIIYHAEAKRIFSRAQKVHSLMVTMAQLMVSLRKEARREEDEIDPLIGLYIESKTTKDG